MDDFYIYQGRLPHWRESGMTYFVTWRLHKHQPHLQPEERDIVVATLLHFKNIRYLLFAHVVMDDHVHALVLPRAPLQLQEIVHTWKSYSANQIQRATGRVGSIWQKESFDRIVRDEREFQDKIRYVAFNPQKRWPDLDGYKWVGHDAKAFSQ